MSRPRRSAASEPETGGVFLEHPTSLALPDLAGCRQHLELTVWHEPERGRICLVGAWLDEWSDPGSLHYHRFVAVEAGPFTAGDELDQALTEFGRYARRVLRIN